MFQKTTIGHNIRNIITYLCKGHFIGVSLERPFVYKNLGLGPSMLKSQTLELKHRTLKPKNLNPM